MKVIQDFKQFIARGNVIDLAVGVIIGGAFGKIVSSLVQDILMPPIGLLTGGVNMTELKATIHRGSGTSATISYGNFIQNVVDFMIIALSVFFFIKAISMFRKKQEKKASLSPEVKILAEIRDLLKDSKTDAPAAPPKRRKLL